MQEFSDRLKLLRHDGETQQEFAARLETTQASISRYLRGDGRLPDYRALARIHRITGADLNWLVCGDSIHQSGKAWRPTS